MAKKFGKFLLFTLVVGTAIAGTYLYLKEKNLIPCKCNCGSKEDEKEDRSYVSFEKETPFEDMKEAVKDAADDVEEFFDDVDKEITAVKKGKTTE